MIRISLIPNIFDPDPRPADIVPWRPGLRPRDLAPLGFDLEGGHAVFMNSRALTGQEVEDLEVPEDAILVFGSIPRVVAAIIGPGLVAAIADLAIVVGVSIGISYGIAALTAPKNSVNTDYGDKTDGPARNFEGIQDTSGPGRPIPFVYGMVRTGGQFLQSFERALTGEQVQEGLTVLHTLMGICLGPIESIGSIQINGNAIETITDTTYETRLGTPDQEPIDGFYDINHEVVHDRPIRQSDGWMSFVTTQPVEAVEITFRFPQGLFQVYYKNGQMIPRGVYFDIWIKPFGESTFDPFYQGGKTISGCNRNPFKSQVRIDGLELGLYEIQIRRITSDDDDLTASSASEIYAISEITKEAQAHPGLAMCGLKQVPSAQLNTSVPTTYTYLVKGFNNIRIYSDEVTYTTGWTDNPAWCLAHFLTDPIHGLGDKYDWANVDLPSFLAWADYCDELVDRGDGILEKRATFNHVFDTVGPSDQLLEIFAQGSGAMLIKRGSKWRVVLDKADDMIWVGGEGNIIPGTLRLTFLPSGSLANRIQVVYADESNDYQRDTYFDELPDLLPGDPYVEASRELWGVTRISQVAREVRRLLLHNKCATTEVEFEAGLDALQVTAGAVFGVSLPTIAVGLASGRILAVDSTKTRITLDEEVTLEPGKSYEIVVHHADGDTISTRRVISPQTGEPSGVFQTIPVLDGNWDVAPGDVYSIGLVSYAVEKFRCIETSVSEDFRRKIKGLRYDPTVYTLDLEAVPQTIKSSIPDPRKIPSDGVDLTLTERQEYQPDGTMDEVLDVDWAAPISAILDHFEVWLRPTDSTSWILQGTPTVGHYTITRGILSPGYAYEVSVVSVSTNGAKKDPAQGVRSIIVTAGITTQPPTPTNIISAIIDGTLVVTVDPLSESDLGPTGYYEWRSGSNWNQSQLLEQTRAARIEIRSYPHGSTTVLVRAVNSFGNKSASAASVSVALYGQIEENIILTQNEYPSWTGVRVGFALEGGTNKLSLVQPSASTTASKRRRHRRGSRIIGWGAPDPSTISVPEGWYTSEVITVASGSLVKARADIAVDWEAIYIGLGDFNSANFSFDSPQAQIPFSGSEADKITILVQSRYSSTDTLEGSFSAWADHRDRGELSMKYLQFRIHAITENPAYSIKIAGLTLTIDLPDKVDSGRAAVLSANPISVTYPAGYFVAVKRLVVSPIGGAIGDTVRVTAEDASGFTAEIRTAAGALTTGTIHYEARGY